MIFASDVKEVIKEIGLAPQPEDKVYTKEEAHEFYRLQYEHLELLLDKISSAKNKSSREYVYNKNSKCPSCGSTEVNDRIKRIQAEGSGSMSGGGSFLFATVSGSSKFEMDTNEVNKCGKCQHEWKKAESSWYRDAGIFDDFIFTPYYEYKKFMDDDEPEAKTGWLKKDGPAPESKLAAFEARAAKEDMGLNGYCREVIKTYFEENSYAVEERRVRVIKMNDQQWKMWGGTVVQVVPDPIVDFLEKLCFWR